MPLAVTHVLLTIILVDLYRDYMTKHKKYFSIHTIFIAGLAGLLPDIDLPITWILGWLGYSSPLWQHGGITHTPLFALLFLPFGIYFYKRRKHKIAMYFFVIAFGILFHLFLDWFLGGGNHAGIMFLWPLSEMGFKVHLLNKLGLVSIPMALDAIILLLWLYYEEKRHKIRDFI